jgi:hypothetical protein
VSLHIRILTRQSESLHLREEAARYSVDDFVHDHLSNGEEQEYRNAAGLSYIANYSKSLPHNNLGEVLPSAYRAMVRALFGRDPILFEGIPVGSPAGLNLTNPQAGLAFDLEGPDSYSRKGRPHTQHMGRGMLRWQVRASRS